MINVCWKLAMVMNGQAPPALLDTYEADRLPVMRGVLFKTDNLTTMADIGKAVEGLTAERGQVTGLLRIEAPRGVLETLLIPILTRLARQHPRLTVEVRTGTFPVDIVAQGLDAGIRIRRFIQQDMVTTRLTGPLKLIPVASRDYLDARGTPKSIADLHQHNCIGVRNIVSGPVFDWELIDGNKLITVKPSGTDPRRRPFCCRTKSASNSPACSTITCR
jgi:DNA-binding transcriptional LysR family regulator